MATTAIALALALLSAGDGQEAAKAQAAQGAREYADGHYEAAAHDLLAAYEILKAPILLYNLGQCERARGHIDEAIHYYRQYLAAAPNAPNLAAAKKKLQEALDAKARPVPGATEPPSAVPVPATAVPTPARSPLPAPTEIAPAQAAPTEALTEPPPHTRHSHWLAASLIAASVVCVGIAIVGVVQVVNYNNNQYPSLHGQSNVEPYHDELAADQTAAQTWGTAGYVLGGAALAGTAAAIFTW